MSEDLFLFREEHVRGQLETAHYKQGFYTLHFYTENGIPVNRKTETVSEFYLYPSGGTLRDANFNIVFYDSQFDTYRGFQPPHSKRRDK
jgi:hypothetical protein